ncbi:hypothetical protein [Natronobacterium texcoconense]|uniref:Uncharacterized protein n=1 Tax=Natronobacterium texcoconense TaxID=1095778 RepID=A0A1H1GWN7_NATTX|nr:hypothetical protein [Natronobacterium texcoconense]SDR17604.1 hypothetical protein SAMN04489842_2655 [Natronobacterium texcoconense]
MELLNRSTYDHGVLTVLEAIAVPLSILATVAILLFGAAAHSMVQSVGVLAGASEIGLEAGRIAVAVATGLVVVSGGALAVVGYRRVLESRFEDVRPLSLAVVPVVAIVAPVGYVVATTEALALPLWAFVLVVVAAHALAFRTIAVGSLRGNRIRTNMLAGAITGLPAFAVVVALASDYPVVGAGPLSQLLLAVVPETGMPFDRAFLVAAPLLVTTAYGLAFLQAGRETSDSPALGERLASIVPSIRSDEEDTRASESETSQTEPSTDDSEKAVAKSKRAPSGAATVNRRPRRKGPVVPSSPSGSGSRSPRATDSDVSDSIDTEREDDSSEHTSDSAADGSESDQDNQEETADSDESEGQPAVVSTSHGQGETDDVESTEEFASDTRIFAGDFGGYDADADPAEVCPDCGEDIPSDGAYTFCPLCGCEL